MLKNVRTVAVAPATVRKTANDELGSRLPGPDYNTVDASRKPGSSKTERTSYERAV